MSEEQYRCLNRISNSDLTELYRLKTSQVNKLPSPQTLQFGSTFHQLFLEPEKPVDWSVHSVIEQEKLMKMQKTLLSRDIDILTSFGYPWLNVETVHTNIDEETGILIKGKLDVNDPGRPIIDLKTTSCSNSQKFFDTIIEYGYDRQAAFYLKLTNRTDYGFVFIGIQKTSPFKVYTIDMSISTDRKQIIDQGAAKNRHLLKVAKRELQAPNGWRPSSWSRHLNLV